jgi:hypothetical protein
MVRPRGPGMGIGEGLGTVQQKTIKNILGESFLKTEEQDAVEKPIGKPIKKEFIIYIF